MLIGRFHFLQEKDLSEKAQAHPGFARAVQEALNQVGLPSSLLMLQQSTIGSSVNSPDNIKIKMGQSPIHCVS